MRRTAWLTLTVGVSLALSACWPAPGAGPDRRAHNPFETAITTETVDSLELAWTGQTNGTNVSDPVLSNRGVHVHSAPNGGFEPDVFAFGMGGNTLWSVHTGIDEFSRFGTIITKGDRIAVSAFDNEVETSRLQWRDAGTGQLIGGQVNNTRLDTTRGSQGIFYSPGGTLRSGFAVVDDVDNPTPREGGGLNYEWARQPSLTLGNERIYHSGQGVVATGQHSSVGGGVRAFPLTGGASTCGPDFDPTFACSVWAIQLDNASTVPVIGEGETSIYVGTSTGTMYAIDAATGAVQWSAAVGSAVTDAPALADGTLFVPTASGNLVALAANGCGGPTCAPLWTGSTGSEITQQPAVAGGVVFTGSANGALRAFPAAGCGSATCTAIWSAETGSRITGAPAVSAGALFVGTADGRLIAYKPAA